MAIMAKNKIKYQGISTLEVLIEAKNYNNWIADEIKRNISGTAIEIGAGTGNLTTFLIQGIPFYITDKDRGLVEYLRIKFSNKKNIFTDVLDIKNKPQKKYLSFFNTVIAINVLEHIEKDEEALKNIYSLLNEHGKLVILVPAKMFAYTKLDKELGHFRRYEKEELINKLTKSGFQVEMIKYFNLVGLFSWTIRNKVKRNNIHLKPYHITLFDSIVPLLRLIESFIHVPIGISLIAVAKKHV